MSIAVADIVFSDVAGVVSTGVAEVVFTAGHWSLATKNPQIGNYVQKKGLGKGFNLI